MACTRETPWKLTRDTTARAFAAELAASPVAAEADDLCDDASPLGRLYLSHSFAENKHDTVGLLITPDMKNNLALRPRGYPEETGRRNGFATFASYAGCLAAWRRRLVDPALCYRPATSMLEYSACYNPPGDEHPVTGLPNDPARYCDELLATINRLPAKGATMPDAPNMSKGLVPLPPFADRLVTTKVQGAGWGNYGQRTVKGFVLHRMQGTLWGTDGYFRDPAVRALTDFGCDDQTGEVIRWCNPEGPTISPWASGPVSAPYGDGAAFVAKYASANLNVVNRDQVSWEIGGYFAQPGETSREDPWSEASRNATAQALAHYAHDYGIPWDAFPIAPQDGFSFVRWHDEYCRGSGKVCPGDTVKQATEDLIARAKAILRVYQLGAMPPAPAYAQPDPVEELEGKDGQDVRVGTVDFWWCPRGYNVLKPTPVLKYAVRGSPKLRADLAPGDRLDAQRVLFAAGEWWAYTSYSSRVPLRDCSPVVTFKAL